MAVAKHKSRTVSKLNDPRAASSRAKIDAAFVELLHRRRYAGIRVSDITRKAGVGRATFYAHYDSKHELLRSELRRFVVPMLVTSKGSACLFDCTAFFAHIRHAHQIYRALTHGDSHLITERILQECLEERVAAEMRPRHLQSGAQGVVSAVAARFVASSLLALVAWWVENDTKASPQEMQAAFESLVDGGLQRILP